MSLKGLDAYSRHKKFINDYVLFYGKEKEFCAPSKPYKTDHDILREEYRFIRTEEDDDESTFEKRMTKKYYDKLFKEYCLADMSRYKHGQIGMRWRTEKEVFSGKGQFICGNKACEERENLRSYEVNFEYMEAGEQKNALVKLRLCPPCAEKLTYKKNKEREKEERKEKVHKKRHVEEEDGKQTKPTKKQNIEKEDKADKEEKGKQPSDDNLDEDEKEITVAASNPWKKKIEMEKTKEEEFEEYFQGLFP